MLKKGLCMSCAHDIDCTFSRRFPVLQCEEFAAGEARPLKKEPSIKLKKSNTKRKVA